LPAKEKVPLIAPLWVPDQLPERDPETRDLEKVVVVFTGVVLTVVVLAGAVILLATDFAKAINAVSARGVASAEVEAGTAQAVEP
jgi:hypothetical protein